MTLVSWLLSFQGVTGGLRMEVFRRACWCSWAADLLLAAAAWTSEGGNIWFW
jgi:hypothetical protein